MRHGGRFWPAVLLLVVVASTSCALPVDKHARAISAEKLPPALGATTTESTSPVTSGPETAPTTAPETTPYLVWFITGDELRSVTRRLPIGSLSSDLIDLLSAGPSADELDSQGLRSAIPNNAITSAEVRGGVALVDLDPSFVSIPTGDQILALGQIVLTFTGFPGVGQVRFAIAGSFAQVPRADGSQADGAVTRDDYLPLLQGQ